MYNIICGIMNKLPFADTELIRVGNEEQVILAITNFTQHVAKTRFTMFCDRHGGIIKDMKSFLEEQISRYGTAFVYAEINDGIDLTSISLNVVKC